MKRVILLLLLLSCVAMAEPTVVQTAAGPEPAPWWMRVEEFQDLAMKWLAFLTLVGGAVVTLFVGIAIKIQAGLKEIRGRQDRCKEALTNVQCQVVDIAKQVPPAPVVMPIPGSPDNPLPPAA